MAKIRKTKPLSKVSEERKLKQRIEVLKMENSMLKDSYFQLRKSKADLEQSETRFKTVTENIKDLVFSIDRFGKVTFITSNVIQYGYSREEVLGKPFSKFIFRDDVKAIIVAAKKRFETGVGTHHEFRLIKKDGSLVWIEEVSKAFKKNGKFFWLAGTVRDITERKRAEEALQKSEKRYHGLFESSKDALMLLDQKHFFDCNRATLKMFGYKTVSDFCSMHPGQVSPPIQPDGTPSMMLANQRIREAFKKGSTQFEWISRRKNGDDFFASVILVPFELEGRKVLQATVRDITQQKMAEAALQESEARYRLLAENQVDVVWTATVDRLPTLFRDIQKKHIGVDALASKIRFHYTYVTPSVTRSRGFTPKEFLEMALNRTMTPASLDKLVHTVAKGLLARAKGGANFDCSQTLELEVFRKDGTTLWVETNLKCHFDSQGQMTGFVGSSRNVTERKRMELEARDNEQRYRTLVENIPQKIFMKDRNSEYLSINENYARDLKSLPADVVGKTDYDFFPKSLADKYKADDQRIMKAGRTEELDEKYLHEGKEIWVHTTKAPVRDSSGKVVGIFGIFWDITERKRMETNLIESETRYRALVESLPLCVKLFDTHGNLLSVNRHGRKEHSLQGWTDARIRKWDYMKSIAPEYRPLVQRALRDAFAGKPSSFVFEHTHDHAQGGFCQSSLVPVKIGGKIQYILFSSLDVTESRMSEEKLKKSHLELERRVEERTSELAFNNSFLKMELDNTLDGILIADPQGKILSTNRRFAEMWHMPQRLVDSKDDKRMISFVLGQLQDPDEFVRSIGRFIRQANARDRALIRFKDGRVFDRHTTPLMGEDGHHYGSLWTFRDISAEAAIDQAKNEFVALASHQLRTPLTGTKWLIQMVLKRGDLNPWQTDFLQDALKSNERMIKLVNDLLNISRLEAGVIGFTPQKTKVVDFLDTIVKEIEMENREKGLKIIFRRPAHGMTAMLDPNLIRHALINLLSNAVKYSPNGKSVTLSAQVLKNNLEISIKDHGIGISNADQKKLFTKFFRSEEATRIDTKGSGLGLYILRKILDVCHGQIACWSTIGKGSTFMISLPLRGFKKIERRRELIVHDIS